MSNKPKIYIVFYTTFLHIYKLARAIEEGIKEEGSCSVQLFQIPETLPEQVLEKMRAPPKPEVPIITPDQLKDADGIIFGFPTRYGTLPAQLKDFIDSLGKLWAEGALASKMCGTFVSSATQHGGQESSAVNLISTLAHFGMLYVPLGYPSEKMNEAEEVMGGGPWGAGVISGKDGTRQLSTLEHHIGQIQGENFSRTLSRYHGYAGLHSEDLKEGSLKQPTNEKEKLDRITETDINGGVGHPSGHINNIENLSSNKGLEETNLMAIPADATAITPKDGPGPVPESTTLPPVEIDSEKDHIPAAVDASIPAPATATIGSTEGSKEPLITKSHDNEIEKETDVATPLPVTGTTASSTNGHAVEMTDSKDSNASKSGSGLKKFFKRLSVRNK